jgi:hypothetical protein
MERSINKYKHILIGIIVKNCGQYLLNLTRQIANIDYPKEYITIVFLENDSDDKSWDILKTKIEPFLAALKFKAVYLAKKDFGFKLKHSSRHIVKVQKDRYNCISQARQYVVDKFFTGNDYIWWVDADFERIPPDTLNILLSYNLDCIAPLLKLKDGKLYDSASRKGSTPIKKLLDLNKQQTLIEIDATNCQELMHRRVFEKGANFYIKGEKNSNLIQSQRMKNLGIKFYLTTQVSVIHHTICGTKPL